MPKPKGKSSAYAFFVTAEKEKFQEENPGAKIVFGDFMKGCGAKWRDMDTNDKAPYQKKADRDRERYEAEMEDYVPAPGEGKKGKKRKTPKDPNAPKRPQTAFFIFSADHRDAVKEELGPGSKVGDVAKRLGEKWRDIENTPEKEAYQERAVQAKAEYDEAMRQYMNSAKKQKASSDEYDADDY